jgi:hypothetical protein
MLTYQLALLPVMQQWDALHAMLIYESLELRESVRDGSEAWKHSPRVKGLGSPFLLKVRRSFYPYLFLCRLSFLLPPPLSFWFSFDFPGRF